MEGAWSSVEVIAWRQRGRALGGAGREICETHNDVGSSSALTI